MPINTNLNIAPYNDDFDIAKKYYRVLFKPGFALQARELTQLQTIFQNQIEQFGSNIFKEGSIIKGCSFNDLKNLSYVKVTDDIIPTNYIDKTVTLTDNAVEEYYYEIEGSSGLKASIITASNGYQTRAPNLNTFYIKYLNTVTNTQQKVFLPGEVLSIHEYKIVKSTIVDLDTNEETTIEEIVDNGIVATTNVAIFSNPTGISYGLTVSEGIIFQKGHFLFVDDQTIILTKYIDTTNEFADPHNISVGYIIDEEIITSQQDATLLDNAYGAPNENAPGADRLMLVPRLVSMDSATAKTLSTFFALRKYENGNATEIRDVSQYNVIGDEMAKRTYEESGDYIAEPFSFDIVRKNGDVYIKVGPGVAYTKGYRIKNNADKFLKVSDVQGTATQQNQPVSFNYGGYVTILNANTNSGVVDLETYQTVNLLDTANVNIGNAFVKNYEGSKVYIFGARMANTALSLNNVRYIKKTGSFGQIEVNPTLVDSNNSKLIFDLGQSFVKSVSDLNLQIRKKSIIALGGGSSTATITPAVGETFTLDSLNNIVVVGSTNTRISVSSPSLSGSNLTFTVGQVGGNITVYYTVMVSPTLPRAKQSYNIYFKTNYSANKSKYSLGISDVYRLLEVKEVSSGKDFTSSFKLFSNQKDDYYDHSYLEKISNTPSPNEGTQLAIRVLLFKPDSSGPYNLFTINSYSGINSVDIPYFEGKSGTYDLRNCIDLRPYRKIVSGLTLSTTEAGASLISNNITVSMLSSNTELFDSADTFIVPALDTNSLVDIEYYMNRTDSLTVDTQGNFFLTKGIESQKSVSPKTSDKTSIAEVYIPGYPSYTPEEARAKNKQDYGIKIKELGVQNYTMEDIRGIEKQLDQLRYYVTLSMLETNTNNLLIQDTNGNNRFKSGIIVDPFDDFSISDLTSTEFNAAIDLSEKSLTPSMQIIPLNLNASSLSGVDLFNEIATLTPDSQVSIISQSSATNYRNCTSNFYNYKGTGIITPEYDSSYDTTVSPKVIDLDFTSSTNTLLNSLQEFVNLNSVNSVNSRSISTGSNRTHGTRGTNTITTTTTTTTKSIQQTTSATETSIGDFVTDIRFNPFMRSRITKIYMSGLRPNTRHYFFFDGKDVNSSVAPAALIGSTASYDNIGRNGAYGAQVLSNSSGELFAEFFIPANTFYVGDRTLDIVDVNTYDAIETGSTSKGSVTYHAYNFSIDKTGLTLSTRIPEYSVGTSTTNSVTTRTIVSQDRERKSHKDPIAQTFFIKAGLSPISNCVYVSKVDLFFKRKSLINGVTVMLREVENGYPSYNIIPFSKVHLTPDQVSVSEDSSVSTTITFKAPVRLETEKEYAIVVMPDANDPDYLIYISKVGGSDLITNESVVRDWGDGVLFTSTNNRAWSSQQDEDLKFILYRYNFNSSNGSITLATDGLEAFTFSDFSGTFINDEYVYNVKTSNTINVSFVNGSNIASATNIGSFYNVGDYLYYVDTGVKQLIKIISIAGTNNQATMERPATSTGTFTTNLAVAGKVSYYSHLRPTTLLAEKSSARTNCTFGSGNTVYGLTSSAYGIIGSVDNIQLSYIQPSIERITDNVSTITGVMNIINPAIPGDLPYNKNLVFNDKNMFTELGALVYSKSNDLTGAKNLKITLSLHNSDDTISTPVVDVENAILFATRYNVSNTEITTSKYISKVVQLEEGFDADDFRLYLTGYRPRGTDIKVYIKPENVSDPLGIDNNSWIQLNQIQGINNYSSTINTSDFKEYVYEISSSNKVNNSLTYTNSTGTYTSFKNFKIKIVLLSDSINVAPRVLDYRGIALI